MVSVRSLIVSFLLRWPLVLLAKLSPTVTNCKHAHDRRRKLAHFVGASQSSFIHCTSSVLYYIDKLHAVTII